jgi:hypothetical protein
LNATYCLPRLKRVQSQEQPRDGRIEYTCRADDMVFCEYFIHALKRGSSASCWFSSGEKAQSNRGLVYSNAQPANNRTSGNRRKTSGKSR